MAPIDELPQQIAVPTRDKIRDDYRADYRFAQGGDADTTEGTLPWIDASAFADSALPLWAQIRRAGLNLVLTEAQGEALALWATTSGIGAHTPATSASGFLIANTSAGGATIFAGDEAKTQDGLRYRCTKTALYLPNSLVPVASIDVGVGANLPADTLLSWTAPRPGCGPTAKVWKDQNGKGLTGGRPAESDGELLERILNAKKTPAASGNDTHIRKVAQSTPGVPIQAVFTYPAIKGPGTSAVVFTVQPEGPVGTRVPTAGQLVAVDTYLRSDEGGLPGDFGLFICTLTPQPVTVALAVSWSETSWADMTPWPPYSDQSGNNIYGLHVTSSNNTSTKFTIGHINAGAPAPLTGQVIAFFNAATGTFSQKRILAVSGSGPWGITCDQSNGASDDYIPKVGQRVSPWADGLDSLVAPIAAYMQSLGPGEQSKTFFDPGRRQRRAPDSQKLWPSVLGNRLINGVQSLPLVRDATLLQPTTPYPTAVGEPGLYSYLIELNDIAVYPQ